MAIESVIQPFARRQLRRAFTLVEVLVVIAILAVLAAIVAVVSQRTILSAEKVTCQNTIRQITVSLAAYETDWMRPPLPQVKDTWDTIMGDPGGLYSTKPLVDILTGGHPVWEETDGNKFDMAALNPNRTVYLDPNVVAHQKGGLGEDGKLYDPWGHELIFAFNSRVQNRDFSSGSADRILHTWGLAEYKEVKPRYENWVVWSYGRDGLIGRNGVNTFAGSDDVKSF